MSPTRLAALGAFLCAAPVGAATAAAPKTSEAALPRDSARSPDEGSMEREKTAIDALVAEIAPLRASLEALRPRYASGDLEALGRERAPLVRDLEGKREELRGRIDEFKTLRKEYQFRQGAALISAIAGGGAADVQEGLRRVMDYDAFPKEVSRVREDVDEALRADRAAFEQARAARAAAARRRLLLGALGAAAAAVAALAFWLARRARGRRLATVNAVPVRVVPEPALAAGPGGPAIGGRPPVAALAGPATTPLPRRPDPPPGAVLGGSWRVLSAGTQTPLGAVFEGAEAASGRPVLIRRVRDELHRSEKDIDRFLERARQVAALRHRNVCEVHAVFVEDERVHIVTERVDGKALADFLEPGRRINLPSVKRVLLQAARAVEHAHQARILHGDLTPAAVLVTRDGLAKVADFGIAIEARKVAARLSWSEAIGSPAYLGPEVELGGAFKESDVFSLGAILYEMTTGALPFEGPNFLAQKRERAFRPPSQLAPGLPKELDALVAKALAPEPQHRFRSAADFAAALEKLPEA